MKVKRESEVAQLCPTLATPWTTAYQAPLSMGFSRQEYWNGVPLPSPTVNYELEKILNHRLLDGLSDANIQEPGSDAQPSIFLFKPSDEQLKTGTVSVVCLVNDFYPKDINVKWKVDGVTQSSSNFQNSFTDQDSNKSTYSLSSILTLASSEYQSHNAYTCEVSHKSLTTTLVKSFSKNEC